SFAKNTFGEGGVNFSIEYQKEDGNIASFFPDFFVKTRPNTFFIVETKGREDLDDIRKIQRLVVWCKDVNAAQKEYTYAPVYVKQEKWEEAKNDLKSFKDVCALFQAR
ncbi:MAG: type III restriction endonuclease subunit R, partial [Candidatus Nephrothrix sp. EaCA]